MQDQGVSREQHAAVPVEQAHVSRRVPREVQDLEIEPGELDKVAVPEREGALDVGPDVPQLPLPLAHLDQGVHRHPLLEEQLPGGEDILAETVADAAVARPAYKLLRDAAAGRQLQAPAGAFAPPGGITGPRSPRWRSGWPSCCRSTS